MSNGRQTTLDTFLTKFPKEKLGDLTLDEYTDLKRDNSFCYWIETKTRAIGSIRGGSSYKFGIYEYNKKPNMEDARIQSDERYAWYSHLNAANRDDAFSKVRAMLCELAGYGENADLDSIQQFDGLGDAMKWKIAFIYSNKRLIPIYQLQMLRDITEYYKMPDGEHASIAEMQKFLMDLRGERETFEFYDELLKVHEILKEEGKVTTSSCAGDETDDCQYWFLVGKPSIWDIQAWEVGSTVDYTLYNDKGSKRRVFQNFLDAKNGDKVICYSSTPCLQIVGYAVVETEANEESICFKKTENLAAPVDFSAFKEDPALSEMQFIKNPNGSFFKLTPKEYDLLDDIIREDNPMKQTVSVDKYSKEDFLKEVFMISDGYDRLRALLEVKQNIILQGAPGVGKTFSAQRLAYSIIGSKDTSKVEMVQFHQSYSYEDFIMGYRPNENGGFELRRGVFYRFCKRAAANPDEKFFFIIDEINRGNISKILGELMVLIEKGYRGKEHAIKLPYNQEEFYVPKNLYIIGMMNTADRSLAMMDYALRRRFSFFELSAGFETEGFKAYQKEIGNESFDKLINAVKALNKEIANDDSLGEGFCIGHSYFCNQETVTDVWLRNMVDFDLIPMIKEYWFDNDKKYKEESQKLIAAIQ